MAWEKEFLKIVKSCFQKKKLRNPRFSVRQYSKKLGLSVGALSELLSGKRKITQPRALQIIELLEINEEEKNRLLLLMGQAQPLSYSPEINTESRQELQAIIKDWRNFIILSALFHAEKTEIMPLLETATKLNAQEVQSRLLYFRSKFSTESQLINFQIDPFQHNRQIFTGESLHAFRQNQLKMLKEAFENEASDEAFFFNVSLCTTHEQFKKISHELRQTLLKYISVEPEKDANQLFQISLQILPFNKASDSPDT